MSGPPTLVVVGAGLAGAKAVEAARGAGFDGRVVLIGEEPGVPYERPPLSKQVLRGENQPAAARVHPEGFYDDHAVEILHGRAAAVDLVARRIELSSGDGVDFTAAVLATGAAPRRLAIAGAELDGIHHLRTVDDAVRIRDAIRAGGRVAVVGAGWIGSEVAASARQMGADVVLVDAAAVPLQRIVGTTVGAVFRDLHADHGVQLRLGSGGVAEFRGGTTVQEVVLEDGTIVEADVVVIGVGVTPRTALAAEARLAVDNGIVVDEHLETSAPGLYAAGDVANAWHPHYGTRLRVEHWANAIDQGSTAGRNAIGARDVHDTLPYFFSDQYDLGMEYVGHGAAGDDLVLRGDLAARKFVAFWHRHGVVTAAMHVNMWDVTDSLKALVQRRASIDPGRLADPGAPLEELQDGLRCGDAQTAVAGPSDLTGI